MWMPGQPRPNNEEEEHVREEQEQEDSAQGNTTVRATAAKSWPKKLSGATLNMRFMQRKKQQEQRRHSHEGIVTAEQAQAGQIPPSDDTEKPASSPTPQQQQQQEEEELHYHRATPTDMYGPTLIGRRSFGGFNVRMERAWNEQHAATTARVRQRRRRRDERDKDYHLYYDNRSTRQSSSPSQAIGNLEEKVNKKRRRQAQSLG